MARQWGIIAVAASSLVLALLGTVYVVLRVSGAVPGFEVTGNSAVGKGEFVPFTAEQHEDTRVIRQRGPVGRLWASLLELSNKRELSKQDEALIFAALKDPEAASKERDKSWAARQHQWTKNDIHGGRAFAMEALYESLLFRKLDDETRTLYVNTLVSLLDDPDPFIRRHALWRLRDLKLISARTDIRKLVEKMAATDTDAMVVDWAERALKRAQRER